MNKKIASLVLLLGLVVTLGACGGGTTTTPSTTETPASPAASPSP
jgi:ABC-type glycerol-3-phosphate transport system substrate-binding protein